MRKDEVSEMKDNVFGVLQRVGRSFMLPIAVLPVAGLLLGIGSSFSNPTMLSSFGLMELMGPGTVPNTIFTVMSRAGDIVFSNLPILFAMGVAIGMAKKEKEVAALAAAISFFIMHAALGAMISIHGGSELLPAGAGALVVGIPSLQMGVFGGILVGLGTAWLHNGFYRIELPQALSFFGGSRFVPIISALVYMTTGILMYYIWPPVQTAISHVGGLVLRSGYIGTWVYGFMERALIPFGLHHVFYIPFWQTALGGSMEIGGRLVEGAQNIFFAQLADPAVERFSVSAARFMSGKFPFMIFGLPGAALAMYRMALPEKKKEAAGLLISAAVTSMLTGITEPLEFSFLFAAPALYVIHCVLAGLSYMLMHMLNVGVGMTFSGGLIDLTLFGILQGNQKTGWLWIAAVGILYFVLYYAVFTVMIRVFHLKTPGREAGREMKLYTRKDVEAKRTSAAILEGLGGRDNLSDLDCCATRLRCTVYDPKLVDPERLKATGASGVIAKGGGVQIIYGPKVTGIKADLEEYLEREISVEQENPMEQKNPAVQKTGSAALPPKELHTVLLASPAAGNIIPLSQVPDEGFAGGMMGDGAAIIPEEDVIRAPEDGTVSFVYPTRHAVGFTTKDGISLLIHVGIDTVKLDGNGFKAMVQEGDTVKKGQELLKFNLDYLKHHAVSMASPVVVTELPEGGAVRLLKKGAVRAGDDFLAVDIPE